MGSPYGLGMKKRYPGVKFNQFAGAEMIAERWGFSREELDRFGLASHEKAARATREGRFAREIVPVEVTLEDGTQREVRRRRGHPRRREPRRDGGAEAALRQGAAHGRNVEPDHRRRRRACSSRTRPVSQQARRRAARARSRRWRSRATIR